MIRIRCLFCGERLETLRHSTKAAIDHLNAKHPDWRTRELGPGDWCWEENLTLGFPIVTAVRGGTRWGDVRRQRVPSIYEVVRHD